MPNDLLNIATGGSRIVHGQSQTMFGIDDVQSSDCECVILTVPVIFINHVQLYGQFPSFIGNNGIREIPGNVPAVRLDVIYPVYVVAELVAGMCQELYVPLGEIWFVNGDTAQFGGAYWCEVSGVGEKYYPSNEKQGVDNNFCNDHQKEMRIYSIEVLSFISIASGNYIRYSFQITL